VDYLRHTLDLQRNAFSKGLPRQGAELADDLERLIALHDASTIAAVFVEPIAGSAGVILPAPGYLQRLRELCDHHGILLVFDEVITGFGRVGMPFAAQRFGVTPDLLTFAKAVSNGAVPLGGVLASDAVHATLMQAPPQAIELFHGYTYSGTRWPAPRHWPRWRSTPRSACSSAPSSWANTGRNGCMRCRACPT
jgi:beta-alanine--pyruvate transaminase